MVYFQTQNPNLFKFLAMEDVGIFYVHIPFGIFYGHLIYFGHVGIFSAVLVCCTKKYLATLVCMVTLHGQSRHLFAEGADRLASVQTHLDELPNSRVVFLMSDRL
jgi:hypothetical protein